MASAGRASCKLTNTMAHFVESAGAPSSAACRCASNRIECLWIIVRTGVAALACEARWSVVERPANPRPLFRSAPTRPASGGGYTNASVVVRDLWSRFRVSAPLTIISPLKVVSRESTDVIALDDAEVTSCAALHPAKQRPPASGRGRARSLRPSAGARWSAASVRCWPGRSPRKSAEFAWSGAKLLLLDTDLTIFQIATATGFPTATRFGIVFNREAGLPPTAFRNRFRLRKDG